MLGCAVNAYRGSSRPDGTSPSVCCRRTGAAKAFWVASDNGILWPYVVVGIVYNVAVAVPLFRRFLSKNGASPRTGR